MTKAGAPRRRYIGFKVSGDKPVRRGDVAGALDAISALSHVGREAHLRLTRFEHPHGVLQVDHRFAAAVRGALAGAKVGPSSASLESLDTSGTIRRLTRRMGVLTDRGPSPKPATRTLKR